MLQPTALRISICLVFISIVFSSCFTTELMQKASLDRKPEKITKVQNAYFDSSHQLVVNFKARFDGALTSSRYHIKVNVDTPIKKYLQTTRSLVYMPTENEKEQMHLNTVYHSYNQKEKKAGISVEYNKEALAKGYQLSDNVVDNKPIEITATSYKSLFFLSKKKYEPEIMEERLNAKHSFLVLAADSSIKLNGKTKYVAINIEPSSKRRYTRYLLLPATSIADIATSPFQAVGILLERILSKIPMM
jgi:hypothetical protein